MSDPYGQSQPVQPPAQPLQPGSAPPPQPQPGYAAPQPQPQPGYAGPQPAYVAQQPSPPAPGGGSVVLANVSFVIGLVLVLLGSVFVLLFPLSYSLADPFAVIEVAQLVNGALTVLLGIAATVTGAIALVRGGRGRGRARAAAGLVLGASGVFSWLVSLLQGLMFQFL